MFQFWREKIIVLAGKLTVTKTNDIVLGSLKIGPDAKIFFRVFLRSFFYGGLFLLKTSDLRVDQKSVKYY